MSRDILGILLLILAVVIGVMFLSPQLRDLQAITIDQRAKAQYVAAKQERVQALDQVSKVFAQQKDRVVKLISAIPPKPQIPELLVTVDVMAQESGLSVTSMVPQTNPREKVVFVAVVGEGDIPAVERFAQLAADNNRPMSISALTLQRGADGRRISFTATIRVPYGEDTATATTQGGV